MQLQIYILGTVQEVQHTRKREAYPRKKLCTTRVVYFARVSLVNSTTILIKQARRYLL